MDSDYFRSCDFVANLDVISKTGKSSANNIHTHEENVPQH